MAEPVDRDDLLGDIARIVGEELDVASVDLWAHDPGGDALVCRSYWQRDGDPARDAEIVGTVVPLRHSHDLRRLVLTGEAAEHHLDDPGLPAGEAAALQARGHLSRLDVPLALNGAVVGVMSLAETRAVRRLTERERGTFARLCRLAARALLETRRTGAHATRDQRLLALLHAARTMSASLGVAETQAGIAAGVAGLFPGVELAVDVFVRRDDGSYVRLIDGARGDAAGAHLDALARQAMQLQRVEQTRTAAGGRRLVVPLVVGEDALGCVDVSGAVERPFAEEETGLVRLLADQAALMLLHERQLRQLQYRSATDPATGLYSAWYFHERLYSEVARARRYHQPLSLLVGELDEWAPFASGHGGVAFDVVLAHLGRMVRTSLRDRVDVACRRGDGGFAVLLPNTPGLGSGAGLVAERIRRTITESELWDDDLGTLGRFTASVGVAGYPLHADEPDDLVAAAEAARGDASAAGGDRVAFAGG